ncbi:MAG: MFS transporter [Chloroflexi bacterium]|nr:MFS transporter [Chloroflexota bacterium]
MITRASNLFRSYPGQFWIIVFNGVVGAAGGNLVWPFLTIYLHLQLGFSLSVVGMVFALSSVAGLLAQIIAGPIVDRFGRRMAMVLSMASSAVFLVGFSQARSLVDWAILGALSRIAWPLGGVATNAMVADLIEPERRPEGYAILRVGMNAGVAIGPAIGGFIAAYSYTLSFLIAAAVSAVLAVITMLLIHETKPEVVQTEKKVADEGYGRLLRDYPFLAFCAALTIMNLAYAQMMIFLPVYIKEQFAIPESGYGFILATNALMVVFFQFGVTRITERYPNLPVMAVGALFIAVGLGSVALSSTYLLFLLSMVIYTVGELITAPTASAYAADAAPLTMRGRYMAIFSLAMGIGFGVGPIVGGTLNDTLGPASIWYGAMLLGLVSTAGFAFLALRPKLRAEALAPTGPGIGE